MEVARAVVLAVVGVGAIYDVRTHRIPNALTFGSAALGVALQVYTSGLPGLWFAASGWCVGLALLLPLFLLRGLGGGDIKLLGAVGAFLGVGGVWWATCFTVLAGALLALAVATTNRYIGTALRNVWAMFGFWRAVGIQPFPGLTLSDASAPRLPYGIAIAVGTLVAVWLK
jgi:prepilin peptidase CpaA